jgi:hypothetical protein
MTQGLHHKVVYTRNMFQFFATFPAGTYPIILKQLKTFSIDQLRIITHDESSVTFDTTLSLGRLIELRYFTNIYAVVERDNFLRRLLRGGYFRLAYIRQGTPHPLPVQDRARWEKVIRDWFHLNLDTHKALNDFYLIERENSAPLLTLRLSRSKFKREELPPGALRPELAHILCLVAGIKAKYTVLDLFAGYGSIPYEAVRGFGCHKVIAVDSQDLPGRYEHPSITWHTADARALSFIADDSIDRVVTDPPWGIYDTSADLPSLYEGAIRAIVRALKPGGIVVLLSGFTDTAKLLAQSRELTLLGTWNILVAGQKAQIYKLQKVN